jgi:hypothetical protein
MVGCRIMTGVGQTFRAGSAALLGVGLLALLLSVFHPHDHASHGAASHPPHPCITCKANDSLGDAPVIEVDVRPFVSINSECLPVQSEPVHAVITLTSGPPRAPPLTS